MSIMESTRQARWCDMYTLHHDQCAAGLSAPVSVPMSVPVSVSVHVSVPVSQQLEAF